MKRSGPSIEFKTLKRSVMEIEARFLMPHLGPPTLAIPTRKEILDVAACVILVHGVMEDFVEGLALWVLGKAVANWTKKKKVNRSTVSLLLYQRVPSKKSLILPVFDNIRTALDEANTRVSTAINDNHGIALDGLRSLFMPLGINVPADPVLTASLELLIRMRHQWAHQDRKRAKVIRSAKDTQTTVSDCLLLAEKLSTEAASIRF
jgi:hypothetical protein